MIMQVFLCAMETFLSNHPCCFCHFVWSFHPDPRIAKETIFEPSKNTLGGCAAMDTRAGEQNCQIGRRRCKPALNRRQAVIRSSPLRDCKQNPGQPSNLHAATPHHGRNTARKLRAGLFAGSESAEVGFFHGRSLWQSRGWARLSTGRSDSIGGALVMTGRMFQSKDDPTIVDSNPECNRLFESVVRI